MDRGAWQAIVPGSQESDKTQHSIHGSCVTQDSGWINTIIHLCYFERFSCVFLYVLTQGCRINRGCVQAPFPSPDPWRWHHSPLWPTGVWGLWHIWGINSVLYGHEWNWILKISTVRASWLVPRVPDSWTSLKITQETMVCRVEFDYLFYFISIAYQIGVTHHFFLFCTGSKLFSAEGIMLKVVIGFFTVCTERLSFMLLNFSPLLIANYWNFAASFSLNQINLFVLYCKSRFIQVNRSWRREKKIICTIIIFC